MAGRNMNRGASHGAHEWRHGWIPLTPAAALMKAKGSRTVAAKLRSRHGIGTRELVRSSRQTSVPDVRESSGDRQRSAMTKSITDAAAERRASSDLRQMNDDQLADHLAAVGDDDKAVERVLAELDRRDRAAASARRRTESRDAARQAKEARQDADFDRRLAAGEDPEEAYAATYGVSVERQRREQAILSLRGSGYRGRGFDELVRSAFQDHTRQSYMDAEDATRGHLLNKAGQAAGVHPAMLFSGPESRARKYASEELLGYWQTHGRMTVDDFKASLLGGHMRSAGTAAFL